MITQPTLESSLSPNITNELSEMLNSMMEDTYSANNGTSYGKLENGYLPLNDLLSDMGSDVGESNVMKLQNDSKNNSYEKGINFEGEKIFQELMYSGKLQNFNQLATTFAKPNQEVDQTNYTNIDRPKVENQNEYDNYYFLNDSHKSQNSSFQPDNSYSNEGKKKSSYSGSFDPYLVRNDFPILKQKINGKDLVWLDNGATTQKPNVVIDSISEYYRTINSNIHRGAHTLATLSTDAYETARETIREFMGAKSTSEIVLVRGTTEGINFLANTYGKKFFNAGDEILISELEHHANIVPWQMIAKERGAIIKKIPINDKGEIRLDEYANLLSNKTKFVAVTKVSNTLGTINPVKQMVDMAHAVGAKILIDGAQSVAHSITNVVELDCDFFVFSGHKIYGPTGIGAVYGKAEILSLMPAWQGGGNMIKDVTFEESIYNPPPAKFEAGTPNIADAIGLGHALRYVMNLGLPAIEQYELNLTKYAMNELSKIPGIKIAGTSDHKICALSFVINGIPNDVIGKSLDNEGIEVRVGHHCALPSIRRFGLEQTVRASIAMYNTKEEVDKFIAVLKKLTN